MYALADSRLFIILLVNENSPENMSIFLRDLLFKHC